MLLTLLCPLFPCCAEDAPLAGAAPSFLSVGGSSSSGAASGGEPRRAVGLPKPRGSRSQLPPVPSGVSLSPGESQPFAFPQRPAAVVDGGTPAGPAGADAAAAESAADEAELAGRPSTLRRLFRRRSLQWPSSSVASMDALGRQAGGTGAAPESSSASMYSAGSVGPFSASLAELSSECKPRGLLLLAASLPCLPCALRAAPPTHPMLPCPWRPSRLQAAWCCPAAAARA